MEENEDGTRVIVLLFQRHIVPLAALDPKQKMRTARPRSEAQTSGAEEGVQRERARVRACARESESESEKGGGGISIQMDSRDAHR